MSEIVDQLLQRIAKGSAIVFIGTILGLLLAFAGRVIVARYVTQNEYGIFSLALVLMNVAVVLSTLGLQAGTTRQLAFYRGKGDQSRVKGVVFSSLQLAVIPSVLLSLALFFSSDFIAAKLFHSPELSNPVKIFCIAIPFFVLINILTAIFRGFDQVVPKVYFQDILRNALFPLFLVVIICLSLPFIGVIYAFMASMVLTFIVFAIYTTKKPPLALKRESGISTRLVRKELLLFSLPLFAVAMLDQITSWTDTLMLGYFMLPDDVGLYNAALPLGRLTAVVLGTVTFLYVPLMTQLYAGNQKDEIKRSYIVLTKWIFLATLPLFLTLVLFPEATLNILFGSRYIGAALALQILSLGFFLHAILGPNGSTLIAIGKNRFLMWSVLITVMVNIILNIVLIPPLGIIGAAIATAAAFALKNILWAVRLYSFSKMHPFTRNYLKPAIVSVILALIIGAVARNLVSVIPLWLLVIIFILFVGVCTLSVVVTRSLDKADVSMLLAIEKELGINLTAIKRILRRFL